MSHFRQKFSLLLLFFMALPNRPALGSDGASTTVLAVGSAVSFEPSLKTLEFSVLDSARFARAMEMVSDVPLSQIHTMSNASLLQFKAELAAITAQIKAKPAAAQRFVFFYSGHSDERGLHFSDGLYSKEEFHRFLRELPAQVKISILDSCYSGALAAKGIEPSVKEFTIPKTDFDEPTGTVFLTASAANEGAFESRRLQGSVFSNHLVDGLYGGADANSDGLVTIDELYQFIYQKTKYDNLLLPSASRQRPEFVAKLQGRGALVLATPRTNAQILEIDPRIKGDLRIQSVYGLRSYSLPEGSRSASRIQLPAGDYLFTALAGEKIGTTSVRVDGSRVASVSHDQLRWTSFKDQAGQSKGFDLEGDSTVKVQSELNGALPDNRQKMRATGALGVHAGQFSHEAAGPTGRMTLHLPLASEWGRFVMGPSISLAVRRNRLALEGNSGTVSALSALAGGSLSINTPFRKTQLLGDLGAGVSRVEQAWNNSDAEKTKYGSTVPELVVGAGISYKPDVEWRVGLRYEREIAEVTDQSLGKRIVQANAYYITFGN